MPVQPLLLSLGFLIGVAALAAQAPGGGQQSERQRFEVAVVRPLESRPELAFQGGIRPGGRLELRLTLRTLISWAYNLKPGQRVLGSQPLLEQWFLIDAKAAEDLPVPRRAPLGGYAQETAFHVMLQELLKERFGLRTSSKDEMVSVLVLKAVRPGEPGPNLKPLSTPCAAWKGVPRPGRSGFVRGTQGCDIIAIGGELAGAVDDLAALEVTFGMLTNFDPIFVDETGLTGGYEVAMTFDMRTIMRVGPARTDTGQPSVTDDYPSFNEALETQLGLRIERQRRPIPMVVVEHVELPSEN